MNTAGLRLLAVLVGLVVFEGASSASPGVRVFGVEHGLADDFVVSIYRDTRGLLWFCTVSGLSRFDGRRFETFGPEDGLLGTHVMAMAETPDGTYWVGTTTGLYRFRADEPVAPDRRFEQVSGDNVRRVVVDRQGRVWVGGGESVAVLQRDPTGWRPAPVLSAQVLGARVGRVLALAEGPDGGMWVGTHADGLLRISPDGGTIQRVPVDRPGMFFIKDLELGPDGRIWASFFEGVARFRANPELHLDGDGPAEQLFGTDSGLPSWGVSDLYTTSDGELLVASTAGVGEIAFDSVGQPYARVHLRQSNGLPAGIVSTMAHDPAGNLWVAVAARGATQFLRGGVGGLGALDEEGSVIVGLLPRAEGVRALTAVRDSKYVLHDLDATGRNTPHPLRLPRGEWYLGWGLERLARSPAGCTWVTTGRTLYLSACGSIADPGLPAPGDLPVRSWGAAEGSRGREFLWVTVAPDERVWIGTSPSPPGLAPLLTLAPGADRFAEVPWPGAGAPPAIASAFAHGPDGALWVAFAGGYLGRLEGEALQLVSLDPSPEAISSVGFDGAGRLWLGVGGPDQAASRPEDVGARVIDEPNAPTLQSRPGPPELTGSVVKCILDDAAGSVFFGTLRGLYQWDEARQIGRRYTREHGLPGNRILHCTRDGTGTLWFSDAVGVGWLRPRSDISPEGTLLLIDAIVVDGLRLSLPATGTTKPPPVTLAPGSHSVTVSVIVPAFMAGNSPRVQYRPGSDAPWSPPAPTTSVTFPALGTGDHVVQLRATGAGGDSAPVTLYIRVSPAFWQQPWFILLLGLGIAAIAYVVYRVRRASAMAMEQLRARIAADLHDDLGSGLSRMALLADMVRRALDRTRAADPEANRMLVEVSSAARNAVGQMGDIVWFVRSAGSTVREIMQRLREAHTEAVGNATITLHLGDGVADLVLTAAESRELYLLLKEAVFNASKHAQASRLDLSAVRDGAWVVAEVRDDGTGFDPALPPRAWRGGNGLRHMRERAQRLRGALVIDSAPGRGTTVRVMIRRT